MTSLSSPPKLAVLASLVFALAGAIFAVGGLASLQAGEARKSRRGYQVPCGASSGGDGGACQHSSASRAVRGFLVHASASLPVNACPSLPSCMQTPLHKLRPSSSPITTAGERRSQQGCRHVPLQLRSQENLCTCWRTGRAYACSSPYLDLFHPACMAVCGGPLCWFLKHEPCHQPQSWPRYYPSVSSLRA